MQKYTPDQLAEVLRLHKLWLEDDPAGKRADLRGANLQRADLQRADLQRADLRCANLWGANLRDADLRGADLRDADLRRANLWGANLRCANLWGADLRGADLRDADLRCANLRGADLRGADLRDADLRCANLRCADLWCANLRGANLRGADGEKMKIAAMSVLTGLYEYQCWAVAAEDGTAWVRMGCLWKSVESWDALGIRNSNPGEFPDDGSEECEQRVRAFEFARAEAVRMAEKVKLDQVS